MSHETARAHPENRPPPCRWFWLPAALLIGLRLWLVRGMTFNGIGYMLADDQLFIDQAAAILQRGLAGQLQFPDPVQRSLLPPLHCRLIPAGSAAADRPAGALQPGLPGGLPGAGSPVPPPALLLLPLALLLFNPMSCHQHGRHARAARGHLPGADPAQPGGGDRPGSAPGKAAAPAGGLEPDERWRWLHSG